MKLKLPRFQRKNRDKKHFLALDIGTEAVKGALIEEKNKTPLVLETSLEYFDRFGTFDSYDFEADVFRKTLGRVLRQLWKEGGRPELLPVLLPPNVLKASLTLVSLKRKSPKKEISKEEGDRISQSLLRTAQKHILQEFSGKTGILPFELQFLNLEVLEKRIDGYVVPRLLGYSGKTLELLVLGVFLPKYYFTQLKSLFKDLDLDPPKFIHLAETLKNGPEGIYLDVGGRCTQLIIFCQKKLRGITQFELGGEDFSRTLSQRLGVNIDRARILKERYAARVLSEGSQRKIRGFFSQPLADWLEELTSSLRLSLREGFVLAPVFFLSGGGSQIPEIKEVLEARDWKDFPFVFSPKARFAKQKGFEAAGPQFFPLISSIIEYGKKKNL
jgi:hypothetical protein